MTDVGGWWRRDAEAEQQNQEESYLPQEAVLPKGAVAFQNAALPQGFSSLREPLSTTTGGTALIPPEARGFEPLTDTGQLKRLSTGQLLEIRRHPIDDSLYGDLDRQLRTFSWVAAIIGSIGFIGSLFVGWLFPLSFTATFFGILGLRRERLGRVLCFVGIWTGVAGILFTLVWAGYYAHIFVKIP
ncbi:MAG: hypothetical protein B5766_11815 [Candidatus Lumbricidophila eiseniae]|uniref:DUF4190 domain-containing protein n=1 Tax=Candidatus Lumbricidiphila eiseniae TaxID=1969409 RepID=A0A2A6FN65_9MICO|nr:MAG: hypothetical protein B5766_11815 [Candidatus Lumbricidophila eiseniae]